MNYWKLGCRWGKKSDGLPLFYDILLENNIIIGWHTMDYQKGNLVLLTDGYRPLAIARTKTERKSIYELPHLEKEFEAKKVYYEDNLFYYDAEIIPIKSDFTYDYQKGIAQIHKPQIINKINQFYFNAKNKNAMVDKKKLLQYKKQIILQGPPGTGKTREAKAIAKNIILDNINIDTISNYINVGDSFPNASGTLDYYKIKTINLSKKEVILVSDKSKIEGNFAKFDKIIERLKEIRENAILINTNGQHPYEIAVAKFIFSNILKSNEQFKLLQFHPSYTYEDFVRGIVAESKGEKIEYKNVNKTLGLFAKEALFNFKASLSDSPEANLEAWIDEKFEMFKNEIDAKLPEDQIALSGDITIFEVTDSHFKYAEKWKTPGYLKFVEFKKVVKAILQNELELSNKQLDKGKFIHAHYRYTYYNALLKLFFEQYTYEKENIKEEAKNYVLIIDEINRANLSSVLGELIYALEYRGEEVESMYEVDGSQKLILPPNLYIIGTMNTADRSVGHIDYAIRRRFAFVDVLPQKLKNSDEIIFDENLYKSVSELFVKDFTLETEYNSENIINNETYLSNEFSAKDVWLGHSYFIQKIKKDNQGNIIEKIPNDMSVRLDYEIKPILMEYVRDGVLKQSAIEVIKKLSV